MDRDKFVAPSKRYNTLECRYTWWGAALMAKKLIEMLADGNRKNMFFKSKNTVNLLNFLLKSKSDMLNFLYYDNVVVMTTAVKDKKGNIKEYVPYRIKWEAGTPIQVAEELEFISPQENRWRDTAQILMGALNNACSVIGVFTGRKPDDIFNELLCGKEIEKSD